MRFGALALLWKAFLDTLFPIYCVGCDKEGAHICTDCMAKMPACVVELEGGEKSVSSGITKLFAAHKFHETNLCGALIHRLKYDGAREITPPLVGSFAAATSAEIGKIPNKIFIPIPLHWKRQWNRGFNQSELIAHELQKKFGGSVQNLLIRARHTKPQVSLSGGERHANIKNAFAMRNIENPINPDGAYFIVDDVFTTGATMNECAHVLKTAGIKMVFGVVIAKT